MKKVKRIIEFSEEIDDWLAGLADKKKTDKGEILRRALTAYVYMHEEHKAGNRIYIISETDKTKREIVFMGDTEKVANLVIYELCDEEPINYFRRAIQIACEEQQNIWIIIGFRFVEVTQATTLEYLQSLLTKYSSLGLDMEK